jgi:hypothetical protein
MDQREACLVMKSDKRKRKKTTNVKQHKKNWEREGNKNKTKQNKTKQNKTKKTKKKTNQSIVHSCSTDDCDIKRQCHVHNLNTFPQCRMPYPAYFAT